MSRAVWKVFWDKGLGGNKDVWKRGACLGVEDIGKSYLVHTGKGFSEVVVDDSMVGQKVGSYVLTKRVGGVIHRKKGKGTKKK